MEPRRLFLLQQCFLLAAANLEGPFVFWGPERLATFRRPALDLLEQDDLLSIYEGRDAVAVFNVQDSSHRLTGENYPRLRKLLERTTSLVLPQDFLDVHPEYVNNETQVITVQGPYSERDAEITEKFQRLEDVYGKGRVLAILGTSENPDSPDAPSEEDNTLRRRRRASEDPKEAPEEVVYIARGKALLYTADFPVLRLPSENGTSDEVYKLRLPVAVSADERDQFSRLIVTFPTPSGKVTLRFRFPDFGGYWHIGPIELLDPRGREWLLNPPPSSDFLGAPRGFSFICGDTFVFTNGSISLTFNEIQVQPLLGGSSMFGAAYNCVNTMTIPIWSGLLVTLLLLVVLSIAIYMLLDIKVMDRFENSKGKTLTVNVIE